MSKHKPIPTKVRKRVWEKYHGRCGYCGCELPYDKMRVDHIHSAYTNADIHHAMTEEEINDEKNLMPSCQSCNLYKSTFTIAQFRSRIVNILMSNLRKNYNYKFALRYGLVSEHVNPVQFYFETLSDQEEDIITEDEREICQKVLSQQIRDDVCAYADENELTLSSEDIEKVVCAWVYDGKQDANLSHWSNIGNLIDKYRN